MRKRLFVTVVLIINSLTFTHVYAQIGPYDRALRMPTTDLYDSELMGTQLNAVREMNQRCIRIREAIQPLKERQIQYYREGKYRDALDLCYDVFCKYVYYVYDNKAISDMEILAGDCALKIQAYELAIEWYQKAKQAGEDGMDYKLSHVFNVVIDNARNAYKNSNYSRLWDNVSIALKTGWESGECYYYYGVCYENNNNYREAKKMYKRAKEMKYAPAISALQGLKKKK